MAFKVIRVGSDASDPNNQLESGASTKNTQEIVDPETSLGSIGRNIARLGTVAAESVAAIPGEIGRAVEPIARFLPSADSFKIFTEALSFLPDQQQLRDNFSQPLASFITGNKKILEPQSEKERISDEIVATATPFLFGGMKTLPSRALKGLGVSAAGTLAKWGSKELGIGETGQEFVKLGTMLGTSLLTGPKAKDFAKSLYESSAESIPEGSLVEARPVKNAIKKIRRETRRGFTSKTLESKNFLNDVLSDIEGKIKPAGTIELKELQAFQRQMNEQFGRAPRGARKALKNLRSSFDTVYNNVGSDLKPAIEQFQKANDIYKSVNSLNSVQEFIKSNPKVFGTAAAGGGVALVNLLANPASIAKAGIPLFIGGTAYSASNLIGNIIKHPGMRSLYYQTMKSLVSGNATQALKSSNKLYKALEKEEKKNPSVIQPKILKDSGFKVLRSGLEEI